MDAAAGVALKRPVPKSAQGTVCLRCVEYTLCADMMGSPSPLVFARPHVVAPSVQALLTDMYQLTMCYAYWRAGRHDEHVRTARYSLRFYLVPLRTVPILFFCFRFYFFYLPEDGER